MTECATRGADTIAPASERARAKYCNVHALRSAVRRGSSLAGTDSVLRLLWRCIENLGLAAIVIAATVRPVDAQGWDAALFIDPFPSPYLSD